MPTYVQRIALIIILAVLAPAFAARDAAAAGEVLRLGSTGPSVVLAQHYLHQLGHLSAPPDGMFGPGTLAAVREFQRERRLAADGVIGPRTWAELRDAAREQLVRVHAVQRGDTLWGISRTYGVSVDAIARANSIAEPSLIRPGQQLLIPPSDSKASGRLSQVELVHWDEAQKIYANFKVVTVIDVRTGKSFQVRRYYGHLHADSEPLTAKDAATLKEIYGGWSWERRPIIVEVDGRRIAASMNGMPHGDGSIQDNGFPGHFCIHFLGSGIHRTGNIDPAHQKAVLEAAGYRVSDLWLARR